MPKNSAAVALGSDICGCGDFRSQHKPICMCGCSAFRFAHVAGGNDFKTWGKYHAAALLGSIKSERKAKASRENGKKGGRPKKNT